MGIKISGQAIIGRPSPVIIPTPTPTSTKTPTPTPTISVTPTITVTPTISVTPTQTLTPTITVTPTISLTPTITVTPTISLTPTRTPTPTAATPTPTPTNTPTSVTPTPTPTNIEYKRVYATLYSNAYSAPTDPNVYCGDITIATNIGGAGAQYELYFVGNDILPSLGDLTYKKQVGTNVYELEWPSPYNWIYISSTLGAAAGISVVVTSLYGQPINGYGGARVSEINICSPTTPTPTPTNTATPTPTISLTPTISITPTISVTPTVTDTPTQTPTISVTPTISLTPTITDTPTQTPTISVTPTISLTPTITDTPTQTPTPTVTQTPTITPTTTITPTVTPSTSNPLDGEYYYISTDSYSVCFTPSTQILIYDADQPMELDEILYQVPNGTDAWTMAELNVSLSTSGVSTFYIRKSDGSGNVLTVTDVNGNAQVSATNPCVTPTPTPTPSITPTTTVTPTSTVTPTISLTPSITPTSTVTPTISLTPSITPTTTITPTISLTPSITPTTTITPTISLTPSITPTISITPTRTVTPTISLTPTRTPTPTPTQTNCTGCTSYDVVITSQDLAASDDNTVYVYHYPCGTTGGTVSSTSFSNTGSYADYICAQNCAPSGAYVGYNYDGGVPTPALYGSNITSTNTNCALDILNTTLACSGSLTYNVSEQGFNTPTTFFDLNQTYGNVDITINISGNTNSFNEIFVGNRELSYGTTYAFGDGAQYITGSVGFISNDTKTTLDIAVYSTAYGTPFTPFNVVFTASCPDDVACSNAITGSTYYSGTTINVTAIGNIKYETISGMIFRNITSTGSYTINDCILVSTLSPGYPLANVASYNNVVTGSSCNSVYVDYSGEPSSSTGTTGECRTITFNANQGFSATAYWVDCDGISRTRFINLNETYTTNGQDGSASGLPVTYGGFL